jgi:hypothetical protein
MIAHRISAEEALGKCAWCGKRIADDLEVYGFGARIRPDIDLSEHEGEAIELTLLTKDRSVPMMVTSEASEAKRDGNDLMFMVCSEQCGKEMKAALEEEKALGDMLDRIQCFRN